jgi:uncharacterized phage protein gp47/JayE
MFILDGSFTAITGNDTITLRALTAGTGSQLNIGDTLSLTSPIAQMNTQVIVNSIDTNPLDAEDLEAYRRVIIQSFQQSPTGGSAVDYRLWSSDANGVSQIYPYASNGNINEIDLYVEAVLSDSIDGKGTPSASLLLAVQSVIEFNPNSS